MLDAHVEPRQSSMPTERLMAQSIAFPQPLPGAARGRHPRRGAGHHPGAALRHRPQLRGQAGGHYARAATTAAGVVLADPLKRTLLNTVFKTWTTF